MSSADELLAIVRAAEDRAEPDALDAARAAYLEVNPTGAAAADVRYRHGLSRLFRHQDADGALALFKAACEEKGAPIAPEARVSYALLLLSKQKRQQAIFELKKMLPDAAPPSVHTASALDFLTMMLRDSKAKAEEIERFEEMRVAHLQALVDGEKAPMERAHWLLRLGAAYADQDGGVAMQKARAAFSDVVKLGAKAGDSAVQAAKASLKALPH